MGKRGGCYFKNVYGGENIVIIKLKDICSAVYSGGTPNKKHLEYYDGGEIPWLNTGEIAFNRIYKTEKYISDIGFRSSSAKWVPANAVIVAMYGASAARTAITKIPLTTNQACCNLVVDEDKADYRYVYYYLCFQYTQLASLANGGAQQNLNAGQIKDYDIDLPDMAIQRKVADLLTMLDDKIEINKSINKNLEQQAQAIFKSWFVNYEPFGGTKPADWIDGTIDDLGTEIICGKTPSTKKSEYYGGNIPFITIPDMHDCVYIVSTERYLSDAGVASQPKKTLSPNTVCVSCIGTAGLVTLVSEESQSNQQINSIIPKAGISAYYIYLLMQTLAKTIDKLGQSGSTIVNLNKMQFGKIQVIIPSKRVLQDFDSLCKPLFDAILSNQKENIRLSMLRDTLLPKLMSGELDVSNIDQPLNSCLSRSTDE